MSYTALYRKYRPSTFEEVAGQRHIVTTLTNALSQNRLAHAYLFSGPSGNGKTSIAKLFAKAINCESDTDVICDQCQNCISTKEGSHPDIIEIDAASNNGVDEIRSLIEKVKYAPLNGKYKVYIIDEVHMLSLGAFNALLKTLEEPPAHVVFILATTEPHKIIPTIISRCQRYDFTRVKEEDIFNNMINILQAENITYEDSAIELIATLADGGVRESLSILEQSIAYSIDELKVEDIRRIYGIVTKEEKLELLDLIIKQDMESTLNNLNAISDQGNNLERLNLDLIKILKECVIYGYSNAETLLTIVDKDEAKHILEAVNPSKILSMIDILMEIDSYKKSISDLHAYLELGFIKLINLVNQGEKAVTVVEESPVNSQPKVINSGKVTPKEVINNNISVSNQQTVDNPVIKSPNMAETIKTEVPSNTVEKVLKPKVEQAGKEEPIVDQAPKVSVPIKPITITQDVVIDTELLLSLLTFANKEKRLNLENKWSLLEQHSGDVKFAKFVNQLKDSKLIAVGENYALISVSNNMFANNINGLENQAQLSHYVKQRIQEELRVYAITHDDVPKLINDFRKRSMSKTLPTEVKVEIIQMELNEEKIVTLEDQATEIFGENGFIIEE